MAYKPAYNEKFVLEYFLGSPLKKVANYSRDITWRVVPSSVSGPIFPLLIKADLASYESFKKFTNKIGIVGFTYLEDNSDDGKPLISVLEEVVHKERTGLPDFFFKQFYEKSKERLLEDQKKLKDFYLQYFERSSRFEESHIEILIGWANRTMKHAIPKLRFSNPWYPEHQDILKKAVTVKRWEEANRTLSADQTYSEHWLTIKEQTKLDSLWHKKDEEKIRRKIIDWTFGYKKNHFARCLLEIIDLMQDEKEIKECAYCGEIFIPSHGKAKYCDRTAPRFSHWDLNRKTCKQVGPQKKFFASKSEEEKKVMKKKKKYQNDLLYLKKKGRDSEYLNLEEEFKEWKEKTFET